MRSLGDPSRYAPKQKKIGILHPFEGEQRRILPRGYRIDAHAGQTWGAITETTGILLPYEVRPKAHVNVRGEEALWIMPYKEDVCYVIGSLTAGQALNGWREKAVAADFFVPEDRLTPYPFNDKQAEDQMRPYLEHSLLVRGVVIDMIYDNPQEYSYELCA